MLKPLSVFWFLEEKSCSTSDGEKMVVFSFSKTTSAYERTDLLLLCK